ncbi:MAG: bamB 1 [Chthoniobacteraceae bacterium]|nr:bamB 1 [Chthoniobacteraceae bacterium]
MNLRPLAITAASLMFTFSASALDWPQFRGPDRSDVSKETGLLKQWPEGGPKQVWLFKNAGNGYAGFSIVDGKLFTMGTRDGSEVLIALDAATGTELWAAKIGSVLNNGWGDGPRGTPTVDGSMVYTMGGQGSLICAQVADGKVIWTRTMKELGGQTPGWGYTESVVVDGNQVICTPGGKEGAVAALDKTTGATLWQSKEITDGAQYSSVVPATINGEKQYVQLTAQNYFGIAPKDGSLKWKMPFPGKTAVIPTPVVKDNFVFVTAGYGVGSQMSEIGKDNQPTLKYENMTMKHHHGGVVRVGENLFGYSDGIGWLCQNFASGEQVWAERSKLGKGAVTSADGMLYCLDEGSGTVVLAEASSKGWAEHGRFKLDPQSSIRNPQGRIWTHPVIANGKLYLRDQDLIFCFDIKG